ncbi:MAG: hypothetical protein CL908_10410 [Deltaproteobacteria bacterium]|nr:hypothetical protein [Deltaproteobacteria bacterium]
MSEHEPVVAPLMGPLLEAGFALVQGNLERMRKSLVPALLGILLALAIATLISALNPGFEPTMEVEAPNRKTTRFCLSSVPVTPLLRRRASRPFVSRWRSMPRRARPLSRGLRATESMDQPRSPPEAGKVKSSRLPKDHRPRRHADSTAHQDVFDTLRLVTGLPTNQSHAFGDIVHTVQVRFGEQSTMGIVRQRPAERE